MLPAYLLRTAYNPESENADNSPIVNENCDQDINCNIVGGQGRPIKHEPIVPEILRDVIPDYAITNKYFSWQPVESLGKKQYISEDELWSRCLLLRQLYNYSRTKYAHVRHPRRYSAAKLLYYVYLLITLCVY